VRMKAIALRYEALTDEERSMVVSTWGLRTLIRWPKWACRRAPIYRGAARTLAGSVRCDRAIIPHSVASRIQPMRCLRSLEAES